MKNLSYLILLLVAFLVMQSCTNNKSNQAANSDIDSAVSDAFNNSESDPTDTASNDMTKFAIKAASGGMMEVQLGELAQQNAASSRVKNFATMMVRDHSKANDQLKALAAQKNITLPVTLISDHQKHAEDLRKRTGSDFDEHYMDMMTKDHKENIDEFEDASKDKDIKDADVKAFAVKTLPILKMHLDSAKAIKESLKK